MKKAIVLKKISIWQMPMMLFAILEIVMMIRSSCDCNRNSSPISIHAFTATTITATRPSIHTHTNNRGHFSPGFKIQLNQLRHPDSYGNQELDNDNSNNPQDKNNLIHENRSKQSMTRRKAFVTMTAAIATATAIQQPQASLADTAIETTNTLQDITIGKGIWTDQNDVKTSSLSSSSSMLPMRFITYMTRYLINYDETIHAWWENDVLFKYSLLGEANNSKDEYNQQLTSNFSSLAKSIELSLLDYTSLKDLDATTTSRIDTDNTSSTNVEKNIQSRFESLLSLFVTSYTATNNDDNEERLRQTLLLFTMLPPKYQPIKGLKELTSKLHVSLSNTNTTITQPLTLDFNENLSKLLPSDIYSSIYNSSKQSYDISPPMDTTIAAATTTTTTSPQELFGPIASKPLKRQRPDLSLGIYTLFGLSGATGCALTHSLVIPFDVVKTKLQTNPNQYKNLIDGVVSISKEETGLSTFLLGSQATIVGYFWYGLSVYPSYSFSKWYLEHIVFDPSLAVVNMNFISLVAGSIAAVIASIGLTPIEAARIRTVAEPGIYRDLGLVGTLQKIASEDSNSSWKALYAGFPSLVTRQVIFGSVKFLAFERACEALFYTFPTLSETTVTALGVSLLAGAMSGALSSVISQPADSVLTYVAKNKVENSSSGLLEGAMLMVEKEGAGSLFRGLGSRCLWASAIISGQFFLYDIFRNILGINSEDLTQVFQLLLSSEALSK